MREVYDELDRDADRPDCPIRRLARRVHPGRPGRRRGARPAEAGRTGWRPSPARPTASRATTAPRAGRAVGGRRSSGAALRLLADFSARCWRCGRPSAVGPVPAARRAERVPAPPRRPTADRRGAPGDGDLGGLLRQAQFAVVIAAVRGDPAARRAPCRQAPLDVVGAQLDRMRDDSGGADRPRRPTSRRLVAARRPVAHLLPGHRPRRLLVDPGGFGAHRRPRLPRVARPPRRATRRRSTRRWSAACTTSSSPTRTAIAASAVLRRARAVPRRQVLLRLQGRDVLEDAGGDGRRRVRAAVPGAAGARRALRVLSPPRSTAPRRDHGRVELRGHHQDAARRRPTTTSRCSWSTGLPCFRSEPDDDQLDQSVGGDRADRGDRLRHVVLAASLGSLAGPCAELIEDSPAGAR